MAAQALLPLAAAAALAGPGGGMVAVVVHSFCRVHCWLSAGRPVACARSQSGQACWQTGKLASRKGVCGP